MTDAARSSPSRKYSWDDFLELDDDDRRELIDGELVEVEVPNEIHEHIVTMLGFFLTAWARGRHGGHGGHALGSGYKVRVSAHRGVMPDVQFFRPGNAAVGQKTGLARGRPDLAVEIVSPSSRRYDRVTKLAWYASIGVAEYWIVDPEARSIERLLLARGRYVVDGGAADDAVFEPPSFDGLTVPLAELWTLPEARGRGVRRGAKRGKPAGRQPPKK